MPQSQLKEIGKRRVQPQSSDYHISQVINSTWIINGEISVSTRRVHGFFYKKQAFYSQPGFFLNILSNPALNASLMFLESPEISNSNNNPVEAAVR